MSVIDPSVPVETSPSVLQPVVIRQRPKLWVRTQVFGADLAAISALLAIVAIVAWQRIWFWDGLAYLDVATFYLPWYAHLGESIRAFDIPGWNPYQFSGTPFAGDPQSGWMYVPAMVFFSLLEPVAAYQWFLVFHLVLAALSTYALARVLGIRPAGALVAATAYALGPFVNHITCCLIHVQLAVWLPVALLGVELATRGPRKLLGFVCAGFAVSQMIAGWVGQGAYNGLLVVGAYAVFRTAFTPAQPLALVARLRAAFRTGTAIFAIGFGLAAAGLFPRLDAVRETNVAGGDYVGWGSDNYSSGWTLSLLIDRLFGDGHNYFTALFYLGGATLTLAFIALVLARGRHSTPFFIGLTLVTAIMSLEEITLVHRLFYLLPRFEILHEHVPTRIVAVQWIGPAMLAGAAVDAFLIERSRRQMRKAGALALGTWGMAVFVLTIQQRTLGLGTLLVVGLLCFGVIRLSMIPRFAMHTTRWAFALLMLLAVVWDPTGRTFVRAVWMGAEDPVLVIPTGPVPRNAVPINAASSDPGGAGEFLQSKQAEGQVFRYFGYDPTYFRGGWGWPSTYREFYWHPAVQSLLVNARAMSLHLQDAQGYNPVQMTSYVMTLDVVNGELQNYHDAQVLAGGITSPILDMLNVRYIIIPNGIPPGRPRPDISTLIATYPEVFRNDQIRVLENRNVLPRAWIVHRVLPASGEFGLLMIENGLVDPAKAAFVSADRALPQVFEPAEGAKPDSVQVEAYESDRVELSVETSAAGFLVLADVYSEGWHAYVNGKRVPIHETNGVLRGVAVPAGTSEVMFSYKPLSLRLGITISVLTTLLLAGTGLRSAVPRARKSSEYS